MKCCRFLAVPALVAGFLCAASSSAHAYTINTTEVGKRIRWSTDTVTLQMDAEFERYLGPGEAYAALAMGFDAWRGLPRVPDMVIRPGTPTSIGHHDGGPTNAIYLLRDWPYESAKLAVTIVTYEMDTGRLLDADIVVNGKANFGLLDEPPAPGKLSYDLAAVLTHEAGHVLGLGESNSGQDATMWPYAKPDDVDKRSLAQDDEDGAIDSYQSAPPPAASGCGPNTVGGRASSRNGFVLGLWMMAVLSVARVSRRRKALALAAVSVTLASLLVGFDLPSLRADRAAESAAKLEALLARGTRDDRGQVEALASGGDSELARRAHITLGKLAARPGGARVSALSGEGISRLRQLMGTGSQLSVGRAKRTGTARQGGLLFTEYQVQTQNGDTRTLRVPGGVANGIGQRVIDAELPPADDQEIAVIPQADGTQHWAYHHAGALFGGHLGDEAVIEGALQR